MMLDRTRVLATDIDSTILPPAGKTNSPLDLEAFDHLIRGDHIARLIYATGRTFYSALEALADSGLPLPDYFVCDVGTRIFTKKDEVWIEVDSFRRRLMSQWPPGTDSNIEDALAPVTYLTLQPLECLSELKVSYFLPADLDLSGVVKDCRKHLKSAGLSASLIGSHGIEGVGLLDVLPPDSGKLQAVEHLLGVWGRDLSELIFAGDSGNDQDLLLSGCRAILVGNAPAAFRDRIMQEAVQADRDIPLHAANGHYLAGVLEGLRYFGVM